MHRLIAIFVLAVSILGSAAKAQKPRQLVYGQTAVIHSRVLGEDRPIVISLPEDYLLSKNKYPVLYLLDGPGHLLHTAGTVSYLSRNGVIPQMIIVGIDNTNGNRSRDLTPPASDNQSRLGESSQADAFLEFVSDELMPYVERRFRTQPYRILVGHSLGGLCAVHALLTQTDMFDGYIAISPALGWEGQRVIHETETLLASRDSFRKSLFVTMGDEPGYMEESYRQFIEVLDREAPEDFRYGHLHMLDEDHGTTPLRSTVSGLKLIFKDWRFPNENLAEAELEDLDAHTAKLSDWFGYEIKTPELIIKQLGFLKLRADDTDSAIEIFQSNVERYPDSANVYDNLGQALEAAGQFKQARKMYDKAYKRGRRIKDPGTGVYKQHLDDIAERIGRGA